MEKLFLTKNEYETIIKATQKQLAKDDSRPILKYIYIKANGYNLEAVALDGFTLAKVEIQTLTENTGEFLITPTKLDKKTSSVVIEKEGEKLKTIQLFETGGNITSEARAITGDFINYNQILTEDYKNEQLYSGIMFDASLMLEILKDMPKHTKIYIPQNKLKPIYFTAKTEDGGTITKILLPIREG